jgi:hypothetical protein
MDPVRTEHVREARSKLALLVLSNHEDLTSTRDKGKVILANGDIKNVLILDAWHYNKSQFVGL